MKMKILCVLMIAVFGYAFIGCDNTHRLNVTIRTDNKDEFEMGTPRVVACVVVGCVHSLNVTWYLGDTRLRPNVYKEVSRGNFTVSSLTFVPSLSDNGKELICRATDGAMYQVFEDRVTITVGQRPQCVDSTYMTIRAVEGESQSLICSVISDPDPEQFLWSFPGGRKIYTSSKKVFGHQNRFSSALVWVPERDDYGPVYCQAFNRFGAQKQPCTFSVVKEILTTPDCDYPRESQDFNILCAKTSADTIHLQLRADKNPARNISGPEVKRNQGGKVIQKPGPEVKRNQGGKVIQKPDIKTTAEPEPIHPLDMSHPEDIPDHPADIPIPVHIIWHTLALMLAAFSVTLLAIYIYILLRPRSKSSEQSEPTRQTHSVEIEMPDFKREDSPIPITNEYQRPIIHPYNEYHF